MSRTENKGHTCTVDGCERPAHTRLLCTMHYARMLRQGDPGEAAPRRPHNVRDPICTEPDCDRPHDARGWCKKHYKRYWYSGRRKS